VLRGVHDALLVHSKSYFVEEMCFTVDILRMLICVTR